MGFGAVDGVHGRMGGGGGAPGKEDNKKRDAAKGQPLKRPNFSKKNTLMWQKKNQKLGGDGLRSGGTVGKVVKTTKGQAKSSSTNERGQEANSTKKKKRKKMGSARRKRVTGAKGRRWGKKREPKRAPEGNTHRYFAGVKPGQREGGEWVFGGENS